MKPAKPENGHILLACLGIILAAFVLSCGDGLPPEFPSPDFELEGPLSEKTVTHADIANRPAIVYWFTSW